MVLLLADTAGRPREVFGTALALADVPWASRAASRVLAADLHGGIRRCVRC
ncbi:MAG: hypothetical protein LBE67_04215 [Kocuria palustris]|nr:hypothetical protein [Kocuria palustris]